MDSFTLYLLLAILLIIGIPIGISYLIYRLIKKKNYDKRIRIIALIPILIIGYIIYRAFYPSDSFYKEDFKEVTGIEFPSSGEILYKTASYPDQFGDYTSVSLVKVDSKFYKELPNKLIAKGLTENQEEIGSKQSDDVLKNIGNEKIEKEYILEEGGGVYYYVGFISDKETLIVERLSW